MAQEIIMPRLSDSMEEGTVLKWLVTEGDSVEVGQPLVEIETDKATVTHEADVAGVVLALNVSEGATVPLGAPLAVIGEPGEELPSAQAPEATAAATSANEGDPGRAAPPATTAPPSTAATTAQPTPAPGPPASAAPPQAGGRPKASPLARRLAAQLDVRLEGLAGSGPNGRVIRADVERAAAHAGNGDRSETTIAAPALDEAGAPQGQTGLPSDQAVLPPDQAVLPPDQAVLQSDQAAGRAKGETTVHELTRVQRTIARRMAESRATIPDFELRREVDMSAVVSLRERLRDVTDPLPSFNDFVVKSAALALRQFPRVNATYRDGNVETHSRINVGIAVAADDTLVVPTIFDADRLSLGEICRRSREVAARVRDGSIAPPDLGGGTFTVSNLGMYGVDSFSAVINPPQAAILAVGSLKPRPLADESGNVVARPTVVLTLACDHRVLYGADGAKFLARVRELLERPDALIL